MVAVPSQESKMTVGTWDKGCLSFPPVQIWAQWEEQMVTMQKDCFLSRVLGSTVSTAVKRIICAWMAASLFVAWK